MQRRIKTLIHYSFGWSKAKKDLKRVRKDIPSGGYFKNRGAIFIQFVCLLCYVVPVNTQICLSRSRRGLLCQISCTLCDLLHHFIQLIPAVLLSLPMSLLHSGAQSLPWHDR